MQRSDRVTILVSASIHLQLKPAPRDRSFKFLRKLIRRQGSTWRIIEGLKRVARRRRRLPAAVFDLMQPDGTLIGSLMAVGTGGAPKPPGAPSAILQANLAVTGGTGMFLSDCPPDRRRAGGRPRKRHHSS